MYIHAYLLNEKFLCNGKLVIWLIRMQCTFAEAYLLSKNKLKTSLSMHEFKQDCHSYSGNLLLYYCTRVVRI